MDTNVVTAEVGTIANNAFGGIKQLVTQLDAAPINVIMFFALLLSIPAMRLTDYVANRIIPVIVMVFLGPILSIFAASKASIVDLGMQYDYPRFVLYSKGFVIGGAACIVYALFLKRYEKKIPMLGGKSGDTMEFDKKDIKGINDDSK